MILLVKFLCRFFICKGNDEEGFTPYTTHPIFQSHGGKFHWKNETWLIQKIAGKIFKLTRKKHEHEHVWKIDERDNDFENGIRHSFQSESRKILFGRGQEHSLEEEKECLCLDRRWKGGDSNSALRCRWCDWFDKELRLKNGEVDMKEANRAVPFEPKRHFEVIEMETGLIVVRPDGRRAWLSEFEADELRKELHDAGFDDFTNNDEADEIIEKWVGYQ